MNRLGAAFPVFLLAIAFSAPSVPSESQRAAKAIWRHAKKWRLNAKGPGGGKGDRLLIKMALTGRLKGRVSEFRAELKTKVNKRSCTLKFLGTLQKGSYYFLKTVPVVGGQLTVRLVRSSCKLPADLKEKLKVPQVALRMFLIKGKLCPGIGSRPMTKKDCFSPGR